MNAVHSLAWVGALVGFSLPAFGQLQLVTSRAAFPTTDTADWSLLGPAYTSVASPFTIGTANGSTITVASDPSSIFERRNQNSLTTNGGWMGNFTPGDALLWNRGDNGFGAVSFDPASLISGAGFNVQADRPGPFTIKLDVFGVGGTLLGSVTEMGFASAVPGTAIFIGFTNPLEEVDRFVATLSRPVGGASNFAINALALSGSSSAPVAAVPEPSTYGLLGALFVFGLISRERLRRHHEL